MESDGSIHDLYRIEYFRQHISEMSKDIGYGHKPRQEIDRQSANRVFIPVSNPDAQPVIELFSSIPPKCSI